MDYEYFLQRIHGVIMPSTGCTEPVAIALNTATARANAQGEVRHLTITLDNYNERILGTWIICLPNQVTIEMVPADE